MKCLIRSWDYPKNVNEGLEKNKNWFEFQLIEEEETEISLEEFTELVSESCNYGRYLEKNKDNMYELNTINGTKETTYIFPEM